MALQGNKTVLERKASYMDWDWEVDNYTSLETFV